MSFSPFIRPADAPQSKLSIIPNAAITTAGEISSVTSSIDNAPKFKRIFGKSVFGISPTVATSVFNTRLTQSAAIIPTNEEGTFAFHFLGQNTIMTTTIIANKTAYTLG